MIAPFYETPNGKLYHGDCLDILPELDGPFDAIIADIVLTQQQVCGIYKI